ncbi:hypothetical protein EHV23_00245 [Lautropia dentalis]|jgi:hypothetical protein|uniref:Energy transducer TonB n=1 Tax=Lautropia dentalis TaxID=2490857 RepID=A0A3R8MTH6_9BURK|nr:hypothetical protein [Lautropia dentalis]RRN44769.1 hypothetical protein EHV23_00245 [Lautropia dentalis]
MAAAATPWFRALNRMDPLTVGIVASLIVHGAMLAVRFTAADPNRFLPAESQLEVVLLNASTQAKPVKAEVLAQVNSEAGGDHDKGRARSPLPASAQNRDGDTLQAQQARIQQLEAEQQRLLALNNDNESTPQSRPQPDAKTADRSEQEALKQQIARMQAQIDRQLEDYAKRPKRLTYGVNATGVNYARYVNAWADRIEKIGTERFPEEARGKMYDALTVTVELDKYGNVVDVLINKKSRFDVLNRKVKEIVLAGAPYDAFTADMRKDGDILQIVRTWTFTNGSLQTASAKQSK